MNILILGAGRVGESVAESLASEQNDITVIDTDPARLAVLQDRLDLRGVAGNGIQPSVLKEAGIEDADMFIACAPLDETNLVACKVAHDVFHVPTTIARMTTVSTELLTQIAGRREYGHRPEIAIALVRNPTLPVPVAVELVARVGEADLKQLAKDSRTREPIQRAARKRLLR